MYRHIFRHIALLIAICPATVGWAYEFTSLGQAGGWPDSPITTVLDVSDFTQDASASQPVTAVLNAYNTWDAVESATRLAFDFKTDDGGNYDVFDTYPPNLDQQGDARYANIVFGGWEAGEYFLNLDPVNGHQILAVTWTAQLQSFPKPKPFWHSEIFFNDAWEWTDDEDLVSGNVIDIETVALHEIGHALGLDHENDVPSVMASFYTGLQRTLFQDDIDAVTALYGSSGGGGGKGNGGGNGGGKGGGPKKLTSDNIEWFLTGVIYADAFHVAAAVPEPSTLAILAVSGLLTAAGLTRRSRSKAKA